MALNTPYRRINPNSINYAAMGQKDPWFALGYALGEGYWNNYNQRGEKKATETAEQMLNNAIKYGDPNAGVLTNDDLIGKYARPDKKQQILDAAIQLPELKYDKDGKEVKGAGSQQPMIDKGLLKWGYLDDKYADNPNPVGDSVATKKLLNNAEIALSNTNMGAFDETQFKLALDKQLMADGRNAYQREAAWEAIKPMIAEKKTEYNNKVVDQLYGLYQQAQSLGDNASADSFLMQINKINPNMGKILMDGRVTERDRFKAQEAREVAAIKASGRGGRSGSKGNSNNDEMNYLTSEIKILQDRKDGGSELSKTEENRLKYLKERKYRLEQEKFGVQNQPEKVNYKNPAQLIADGKANIKDGKATNAEIRNLLNDMLKDGRINQSVFDEVIKEFADKPATLKARRYDEDSKPYMFNGRDVSKRSGIALSAEDFELIEYLGGTRDRVFPKEKKA